MMAKAERSGHRTMRRIATAPVSLLRKAPLWPRLVVAVSLAFVVLLAIVGALTARAADENRDRIFQERLVIGQMAASQVDSIFEHAFSELERAAASDSLAAAGTDPVDTSAKLQKVLDGLSDIWLGLYLFDSDGNPIASVPVAHPLPASAPPDIVAVRDAIVAGERRISNPYLDAATRGPAALLFVRDVTSRSGTTLTLAGAMDLARADLLGTLSEATRLGKTGHAELFDGRGLVIEATDSSAFLAPGEHLDSYLKVLGQKSPVVEAMRLDAGSGAEAGRDGETHIMAFAPLSRVPWGIAVGGSESETLAPVTHLRNYMLIAGAVALAVMWVLTLVGARLLVRPVRSLTRAADGITAGDLETPIHVGEGGEIGRLGDSLDSMRLRLRASLADIEQRDRELERRVTERTMEVQTLYEELQHREELRGRLLESVISAQEDERKRIARELHDETGQALTGIVMSLEIAQAALDREPTTVSQRLEAAKSLASQSIAAIRRLVVDLRPAALDDLGLVPAIRAFAGSRLGEKGIRLEMQASGFTRRLSPPVETCLFRVAQEAVTNVVRHSQATSARIELVRDNGFVSLLVSDDGQGFDVHQIISSSDPVRALGLAGMDERVSLLGGQLTVDSDPGNGTIVRAIIPSEAKDA
jgi:signal transduction histidine kinase